MPVLSWPLAAARGCPVANGVRGLPPFTHHLTPAKARHPQGREFGIERINPTPPQPSILRTLHHWPRSSVRRSNRGDRSTASVSAPRPSRPPAPHSYFRAAQPERLDPQSQSLSRSYGSNLPTSLTYIVLSTRGCSPWRPAADIGTARHEHQLHSPGFSRADGSAPDTPGNRVLYGGTVPFAP